MITSKLKTITTKNAWSDALAHYSFYDFYHTYDYHQLSKKDNEEAVLISYEDNGIMIHLPLLVRPLVNEAGFYDATSVYGYAGPLCNKTDVSQETIDDFSSSLLDFLNRRNIVSIFSRLNPYSHSQEKILQNLGTVETLGPVVNIDLTKDVDTQRTLFSKTTKRYLNKIRKICSTKISTEEEDILKFIELYYENMDRVNADESYYFDKDYFFNFINSDDYQTDVIFAILDETKEIISAAMMVKTKNIIQYHISGTLNDYLNITPIRLLIDTMRLIGTEQGYTYFNLGGGLGSQNDSLLQFKSSFSKDYRDFKIWKFIVNPSKYDELVKSNPDVASLEGNNFFPLYRYKSR